MPVRDQDLIFFPNQISAVISFVPSSQGYKGSKGDMGMPGASGDKGTTGLPGLPVRIYKVDLPCALDKTSKKMFDYAPDN